MAIFAEEEPFVCEGELFCAFFFGGKMASLRAVGGLCKALTLFAQPARGIEGTCTKIFPEDLQCTGAPQCSVCQGAASPLPAP